MYIGGAGAARACGRSVTWTGRGVGVARQGCGVRGKYVGFVYTAGLLYVLQFEWVVHCSVV